MRPQHETPRAAAPRLDISAAHRGSSAHALVRDEKEIVRAGLDAELRRPALSDFRKLRLQSRDHSLGAGDQDPGARPSELPLLQHGFRRRFQRGRHHIGAGWLGAGCHQRHRIDRRPKRVGNAVAQRHSTLYPRAMRQMLA